MFAEDLFFLFYACNYIDEMFAEDFFFSFYACNYI
jgi:hypothetical protein